MNPSGTVAITARIREIVAGGTAGGAATGSGPGSSGGSPTSGGSASWVAVNASSSRERKSLSAASASSMVISPRLTSFSVYSLRTDRFSRIFAYINGCVKAGSSPSLCPQRR